MAAKPTEAEKFRTFRKEAQVALRKAERQRNNAIRRNGQLRLERDRLLAALEKVEWIRIVAHGESYCPWCRVWADIHSVAVHKPDCPRQTALEG